MLTVLSQLTVALNRRGRSPRDREGYAHQRGRSP
jgi:hypothetical protein